MPSQNQNQTRNFILQLFGLVLIPLLGFGAFLTALFVYQANQFSGTYFTGDWIMLLNAILILEAFGFMAFSSLISMGLAIFLSTLILNTRTRHFDILVNIATTVAVYGWLFWVMMDGGAKLLGIGTDAVPSALLVYFVILPFNSLIIGIPSFIANVISSLVTSIIPGGQDLIDTTTR